MTCVAVVSVASVSSVAGVPAIAVTGMGLVGTALVTLCVGVVAGVLTGSGAGVGVLVAHSGFLSSGPVPVSDRFGRGGVAAPKINTPHWSEVASYDNTPGGYPSRGESLEGQLIRCGQQLRCSRTFHLSPSRDYTAATCEY